MKPLVIFMAGPTAAGKSEMAYYLSGCLGLPILSTDSIRHDVKVATGKVDINDALKEFEAERAQAAKHMYKTGRSFIYDGSADRRWPEMKQEAEEHSYNHVLISFDLDKEQVERQRAMFDRGDSDELFKKWLADHAKFLADHDSDVDLHITSDNYKDRYKLAIELVKPKLKS